MSNAYSITNPMSSLISVDSNVPSFITASRVLTGQQPNKKYPVDKTIKRQNVSNVKVFGNTQALLDSRAEPSFEWQPEKMSMAKGGQRSGLSLVKDLSTGRKWPSSHCISGGLKATRPSISLAKCSFKDPTAKRGVPLAAEKSVVPCDEIFYVPEKPVIPSNSILPNGNRPGFIAYDPRPSPVAQYGRIFTQTAVSNLNLIPFRN